MINILLLLWKEKYNLVNILNVHKYNCFNEDIEEMALQKGPYIRRPMLYSNSTIVGQ